MADISTLRDALQVRLDTIDGLRAFDLVQDRVPTPAAWVRPIEQEDHTFDGERFEFAIDVIVSVGSFRAGQDTMDGFISPSGTQSIVAAIENDVTLGGNADSAAANLMAGSYGLQEINGITYLVAQISVEVFA